MTFSIITPSFNQLDWLRLCVASVRDQIDVASNAMRNAECRMGNANSKSTIHNPKSTIPPLAVEHIIQDAGSPGIEGFAREVGAAFYRDGVFVFPDENAKCEMGSWKLDESQHGDHQPIGGGDNVRPSPVAGSATWRWASGR